MSRSGQRTTRALAALLIAAAPVAVAGCSAGFSAASQKVRPDVPGASLGDLRVQNVAVVVAQDPTTNLATGPAELVGAVVNTGDSDDVLQSVTIGSRQTKITPGGGVAIPAGGLVSFAAAGSAADSPDVVLPDGSNLRLGTFVPVTFTFAEAGSVTVDALAAPNTGVYANITPPAATPSASASATATATPSTTATPSGSTTPSTTPTS